jgi:SAM-dependent methyltransferase/glycosyltransferase involved in cell wall biosynthesis
MVDLPITGERFMPMMDDIPGAYAHLHRYMTALRLCRDKRVLDIACGEGYGAALLASVARTVIGADSDWMATRYAAITHPRPNIKYVQANAERLPFAPASLDVVTCFETLEHFTDHDAFLAAVSRSLTATGLLLISTPDRVVYGIDSGNANPFHKRELTLEEFRTTLANHFTNIGLYGQNLVLTSALGRMEGPFYLTEPAVAVMNADLDPVDGEFKGESQATRKPQFFFAVCSNGPLPELEASILLDNSESLFDRIIPRLYKAGRDLDEAGRQITILTTSAADLRDQIAEAAQQIDKLTAMVQNSDSQLRSTQEANQQLQAALSQHDHLFAEYDRQIAARDRELVNRLRTEAEFSAAIAERDRMIADRDRKLTEYATQAAARVTRDLHYERALLRIQRWKTELEQRQQALDREASALGADRASIAEFTAKLRMLENQIAQKDAELKQRLAQYQNENSYVVYQNGIIERLRQEIAAMGRDIALSKLAAKEYKALRERLMVRFLMNRIVPNKHRFPLPALVGLLETRRGPVQTGLVGYLEPTNRIPIAVGKGTVFILFGWVYHPDLPIRHLELLVDGVVHPVVTHSYAREDVLADQALRVDRKGLSLTSGFIAHITQSRITRPHNAHIAVRAQLVNGQVLDQELGWVQLVPEWPPVEPTTTDLTATSSEPLVAICMATYNPPIDLFQDQIESIRAQQYTHWFCIINDDCSDPQIFEEIQRVIGDDPRFRLYRNDENRGFYRNFETALYRVPAEAAFVALSDQDDHWFPEKLTRTLAAFTDEVQLAYCDQRIIDRAGNLLSTSFWTERRNNHTDLTALILANTVTGAASVFRSSLLRDVLPFPVYPFRMYHDHWIACIALLRGKLAFVDSPLYAYRQHSANVVGHSMPAIVRFLPTWKTIRRWLFHPGIAGTDWLETIRHDSAGIFEAVYQPAFVAQALLARVDALPAVKRKRLERLSRLDRSAIGWFWETLRAPRRKMLTYRAEWRGLRSILSARFLVRYYKARRELFRQRYIDRQFSAPDSLLVQVMALPPDSSPIPAIDSIPRVVAVGYDRQSIAEVTGSQAPTEGADLVSEAAGAPPSLPMTTSAGLLAPVRAIIAPLQLDIQTGAKRRVNIVLSTIDFRYVYGGYLGMFNLALKIARAGYSTRVIIAQETDYNPARWREEFARFDGLEDFMDLIEIGYHFDRTIPVIVNPDDRFVSTSWWTTFTVHDAIEQLNQPDFIYFAQEYEPLFHPASTMYALAMQSYEFSQKTIFSTALLRDYFRIHRIGVYRASIEQGDQNSLSIENAIARLPVSVDRLRGRKTRHLLFYARPEEHALRNMFEVGVMALQRAIELGVLDPGTWEFYGIGSLGGAQALWLTDNAHLTLMPKVPLKDYHERLTDYDIGLSLMLTPHPSLVPLDMAAAGLITVTNTFANKTAEALAAISPNLVGVAPTVDAIVAGLKHAAARVEAVEARVAGSDIHWARAWDEALSSPILEKIKTFIGFAPDERPI